MCKLCLPALVLPFTAILLFGASNPQAPPQSIPELKAHIEKILTDTHTPGVSIAIVHRDGPEWVTALGKADVATGRDVAATTLFRIGSTSKAFTALSILKLVREGKLSLNDPIHNLVPEIGFDNRWEATDPVRVVHLLEHTTGWDDMHIREFARNAPAITLRDALDFGRPSRVSRWRPGTRMSYCNTGPAVAAYIVEKVTGQRFEDYVEQNFFLPLGMKSATYFQPDPRTATTLYRDDGKTPYPFWNIIYRPAGAISASAQDMAAYVQFYLNRGTVNGVQVVPAAEIDRMESPASTWAAHEGLKSGYGLSNYWTFQDGFVYHGHDGAVDGSLTDMAYMPEYGVGYSYSINTGNGDAFWRIGQAIRSYITLHLEKPTIPAQVPLPSDAAAYAGWYEPDSVRLSIAYFLIRLLGMSRVHFDHDKLVISSMNRSQTYVPVGGRLFCYLPASGPPEPAPSLALLTPNNEGRFIQAGGDNTLKRIPSWVAFAQIALIAFVVLAMASVLLYAPVWIVGGLFKKRRRPAERAMRAWPLVAVLSLIAFVAIFVACKNNLVLIMGNLTIWSASVCIMTLVFAAAALLAAITALRLPREGVRPWVRTYSIIVSLALLILAAYLTYWGVIGLRTWV